MTDKGVTDKGFTALCVHHSLIVPLRKRGTPVEYAEWQGHFVAYIFVMEKLAQAGEGVGVHAQPPFTISSIMYNVVVYAPADRAETPPLFLLYTYMYSLRHLLN